MAIAGMKAGKSARFCRAKMIVRLAVGFLRLLGDQLKAH